MGGAKREEELVRIKSAWEAERKKEAQVILAPLVCHTKSLPQLYRDSSQQTGPSAPLPLQDSKNGVKPQKWYFDGSNIGS